MAGRNPKPPWSDLPSELLSTIANSLASNPIDILTFRSVCKSWAFSSSLPSSLLSPLLPLKSPIPPPPLFRRYCSSNEVSLLSVTTIFALHPPHHRSSNEGSLSSTSMPINNNNCNTWLMFVDQVNPGKVCIRHPFSKWSYSMPLDFPRKLNLLDFRVSEVGRFYNLSYVYNRVGNNNDLAKPRLWCDGVAKVVLLPNELAAVALFEEGTLGLLRLEIGINSEVGGCTGTQWEILHSGKRFRFDDIVDYKGRVLGVDRRGRVYELCYHNLKITAIFPPIAGGGGRRKRLVESLGMLYLVVRCHLGKKMDKMAAFKVYELNEVTKKWVEVTSLGDRIFFFGCEFALSASAQELDGSFGKNCIMFKQDSFQKYSTGDDDYSLFAIVGHSDLRIGVCQLDDAGRVDAIGSCPGYSAVFWPPPDWIWPDDNSKRLGFLENATDRLLMRSADDNLKTVGACNLRAISVMSYETVVTWCR